MDAQHYPHFNTKSSLSWTAIISLLFSGLGSLMLLLIVLVSQWTLVHLVCSLSTSLLDGKYGNSFIIFSAISLPLLLAVILSLMAKRSSPSSGIVVLSLAVAIGLSILTLILSPWLLFLSTYPC
jgi:hypothetical protein